MSEDHEEQEPKLIVDSDWKEQVQKEKEAFADEPISDPREEPLEQVQSEAEADDSNALPPPPPASFEMLISMLASQALVSLGQIPNPISGKSEPSKAYARHYIDTIAMLEEKTKGNLDSRESAMISQSLHQLRLLFVSM